MVLGPTWCRFAAAEGELGQVDEALLAGVRGVEGEGLDHEVGAQAGRVQASLYLLAALQLDEGVEVAVGHPDGALGQGSTEGALV